MTGLVDRQRIKIPMIHKRIFCYGINISGAAGFLVWSAGLGHLSLCSTADSAPLATAAHAVTSFCNQTLLGGVHSLRLLHDRFRQKIFIFHALLVEQHSLTVWPSLLVTISESPVCIVKIKQCVDIPFKHLQELWCISFSLSLIEMVDWIVSTWDDISVPRWGKTIHYRCAGLLYKAGSDCRGMKEM